MSPLIALSIGTSGLYYSHELVVQDDLGEYMAASSRHP